MRKEGHSTVVISEPRVSLARDATVSFHVEFDPVQGQTYTLDVDVEDKHGQHVVVLIPSPLPASRRTDAAG